jgi:hypothetical protein
MYHFAEKSPKKSFLDALINSLLEAEGHEVASSQLTPRCITCIAEPGLAAIKKEAGKAGGTNSAYKGEGLITLCIFSIPPL